MNKDINNLQVKMFDPKHYTHSASFYYSININLIEYIKSIDLVFEKKIFPSTYYFHLIYAEDFFGLPYNELSEFGSINLEL